MLASDFIFIRVHGDENGATGAEHGRIAVRRQRRFKEDSLQPRIDQKATQSSIPSPSLLTPGDCESLCNVLGSQRQRLFRAAVRLLGNTEDAEDAVQEGLLAALRHLHQFEGRSQLSTWLTRIVMNAALMRLRRRRTYESEPMDEQITHQGGFRLSDLLVDRSPNPEEVCVRTEQRRILSEGLKGLSGTHRRALWFHHFQGMTTKEAARALGLCEGTVKSRVHRARQQLSENIRKIQEARVRVNLARVHHQDWIDSSNERLPPEPLLFE